MKDRSQRLIEIKIEPFRRVEKQHATFAQCGHLTIDEMTDDELSACPMVSARTEFHGEVLVLCCAECYEKVYKPKFENISVGCEVKR